MRAPRPRRRRTCSPACGLRGAIAAERGAFLVEALVGAVILLMVGAGVLKVLDRSAQLGGEQKRQAVAGNVAQTELEQIRALPLAQQSNLRRTTTSTVAGITYAITSRTDWVNDSTGDAGCTTPGSTADYMKLSTVVSWPNMGTRKPITLESLITPGVRSFGANQGSLAVQMTDRLGHGVSGLQLNLSGGATLSDPTSATGCVLWGYLNAGNAYTLGFSHPPDYVLTDGSTVVSKPVAVVGDQTSNVALQYDRGGYLQTSFTTKRSALGASIPTSPQVAHVTNSGGGGVSLSFPVSADRLTTGLLFPFTSAYTIHADSCAASEVPVPPPRPNPPSPAAPSAVSAIVIPGTTTASASMALPAANLKVTSGGLAVNNAIIRVTTACGTVYRRTTTSDGLITDPGFPYATSLAFCISDGVRNRQFTQSNTNFNGTSLTMDVRSTDPAGTCP